MPSKKQLITNKLNEMTDYCCDEKMPFCDKIVELHDRYTIETITGMVERFLIPVKDELRDYLSLELDKMRLWNLTQPEPDTLLTDWTPTDDQLDRLIVDIGYIIRVIEF